MKNLHAMVAVAAVSISLASCGTISKLQDFSISQTTLDEAMSAYDTAFLAPAKNYRAVYDKNPCAGSETVSNANGVCAQYAIVVKLQKADKVVEDALSQIQGQLDTCKAAGQSSCTGISTLYSTLKTAISAAEQITIPAGA